MIALCREGAGQCPRAYHTNSTRALLAGGHTAQYHSQSRGVLAGDGFDVSERLRKKQLSAKISLLATSHHCEARACRARTHLTCGCLQRLGWTRVCRGNSWYAVHVRAEPLGLPCLQQRSLWLTCTRGCGLQRARLPFRAFNRRESPKLCIPSVRSWGPIHPGQ